MVPAARGGDHPGHVHLAVVAPMNPPGRPLHADRDAQTAAPLTPIRRWGRRIAWGGAGVLALTVIAVCAAEMAGWPFLAQPMQNALSAALHRPVYFEGARSVSPLAASTSSAPVPPSAAASSAEGAVRQAGGVRVRLFGSVDVRAQRIEIAAPAWSQRPPLLVAEGARLQMRYVDLWRAWRGAEPLRVRRLEAERLVADLERRADGRASWQFGPTESSAATTPPAIPVFGELRVGQGELAFRDAVLDSQIAARFSLWDGSGAADASASAAPLPGKVVSGREANPVGLKLQASGRYQKLPLKLALQSVGVLPWVSDDAARIGVPLTVDGEVGRARLQFDGSVRDLQRLAGLDGKFRLAGPSLAAVGDVIGVTLPTTGPFSTRGQLTKTGAVWQTRIDEALIGRSKLSADLRYDAGLLKPLLSGSVKGPRLLLADLGPAIGTAPVVVAGAPAQQAPVVAAPGRVLPAREFDLPALRAMNADVKFDLDELDLGTQRLKPLRPLQTHLLLSEGVLELRTIEARTAEGRLQGTLSLDGRAEVAVWRSDLRWSQVRIEQWLTQTRANGGPPYVTGRLDGRAKLEGRGRSTAQILGSLEGELFGRLREGTLSHLLVEGAGIDLAQAIGVLVRGDDPLTMDCAVANLRVDKGVARPKAMVIDARDSVIWVDGSVSLADETLNLRAVVAPRDFSPLALRTPVKVQGTLSKPQVSLEAGPLVGKIAAAALLAALNPLAAILPLMDFGSDDVPANVSGGCRALARQSAQQIRSVPKS